MKKVILMIGIALFAATLPAMAVEKVGMDAQRAAHREEMKKIKKAMQEERAKNPKPAGDSKWSQFWKKEGERSGLGQSGNGVGNFMRNLNPAPFFKSQQEQYKARKAAAGK